MKRLILVLCLAISRPITAQSIAIVELFTSQGCSSCPAADLLLRQAVASTNMKGKVYGLSFHVSYWDRLGWKDPYSNEAYSNRQKWYASKMHLPRIYTPQMIVDGTIEFVGSQKDLFKNALEASFLSRPKTEIQISSIQKIGDHIIIKYLSEGLSKSQWLHAALVQKRVSNRVPRGENAHKTLIHSNVVLELVTSESPTGLSRLSALNLDVEQEYQIILYSQDYSTLKISAVGVAPLNLN